MKKRFFVIIPTIVGLLMTSVVSFAQTGQTKNTWAKIEVTYAGKSSGTITKREFLSDSTIHANYKGANGSYKYKAVSFRVTIIQKGKDPMLDIRSDGNKMPQRVRDIFKDIQPGSKVIIDFITAILDAEPEINNAIVKPTDTSPRGLEPLNFTIVDE